MSEAERFLAAFHDADPGGSPRAFAAGRLPDGRDTYTWLAEGVRPGDRALDLCCGDGHLLDALAAHGARVTGLDLSSGELAAARARGHTDLHLGRAQALPFGDAAFDVVTCSWALMLLDDVPTVLAELVRVLRPGGTFRAIVGAPPPPVPGNAWIRLGAALRAAAEGPALSLGDRRTRSVEGLCTLLSAAGFTDARADHLPYDVSGPAEHVVAHALGTYDAFRLSPAARERLRAEALADLGPGVHPCVFGVLAVSASRP